MKDVDGFDKLMSSLAEMTFIRDEKGQPIPDPNNPGAFQNNGSLAKMIDFSAQVRDQNIVKLADMLIEKAPNDEAKDMAIDLKGALEYVGKFIKNGYKFDGQQVDPKTLPPEVQERLSRADKIEKDQADRQKAEADKQYDESENTILEETHKQLSPMINEVLSKADAMLLPSSSMLWPITMSASAVGRSR